MPTTDDVLTSAYNSTVENVQQNLSLLILGNIFFKNTTKDSVTMHPSFKQISNMESMADDNALHKTAVLVIMSILIFISVSISGAVLVFCKKKNAVFTYQKSEQTDKDYEYEMDHITMETDSTDSAENNEPIRSHTFPTMAEVNSKSTKTRYKFIPKSNTFSGTDSHRLDRIGEFRKSPNQRPNSLGISDSLCTSSSPSLNFKSLTIQVDIEPCLQTQSSECLTEISSSNDHSSTSTNQISECVNSYSAERLKGAIPWDYDYNSCETATETKSTPYKLFHEMPLDSLTINMTPSLTTNTLNFTESFEKSPKMKYKRSDQEKDQEKKRSKCNQHILTKDRESSEDSEEEINKPLLSDRK